MSLTTVQEYLVAVANSSARLYNPSNLYRGQRDETWELRAKIDRIEYEQYRRRKEVNWSRETHERKLFDAFRIAALPFLNSSDPNSLSALAVGQHHGLATRLLDWTTNPLAALYFAVCDESDTDSCVFKYAADKSIGDPPADPFSVSDVLVIDPSHVTNRIPAQSGKFTLMPFAGCLDGAEVEKFVIAQKGRREIKHQLAGLGVTEQSLFPDLEGVARFTTWRFSSLH